MFPSLGHCWVRQRSSHWPSLFLQPGQHGIGAVPACADILHQHILLGTHLLLLHAQLCACQFTLLEIFNKASCSSHTLGDSLLAFQRVLHNPVEGVSCTFHRCLSMLFMQNLHCCYNICTIVINNSLDFLWWSVKFGNYLLNLFCNICSCVSLFQGLRYQAVGHHFRNSSDSGMSPPYKPLLQRVQISVVSATLSVSCRVFFILSLMSSYFFFQLFCEEGS